MSRGFRTRAKVDLLPPAVAKYLRLKFAAPELLDLRDWLEAPGWPEGTMNAAKLDGYLIGLLVWPAPPAPGAWMPRIWNDAGWRVPPILDDAEALDRFAALVVGRLQELDGNLHSRAHVFASIGSSGPPEATPTLADLVSWSSGFRAALLLGAQDHQEIGPSVRAAFNVIARLPSRLRDPVAPEILVELHEAVVSLADMRVSRGPLGSLPERPRAAAALAGLPEGQSVTPGNASTGSAPGDPADLSGWSRRGTRSRRTLSAGRWGRSQE